MKIVICLLILGFVHQAYSQAEVPPFLVAYSSSPFQPTGSRLSLACAAYGSPLPTITWSSAVVTDYAAFVDTNTAINIYTTNHTDDDGDVFIISILELCDSNPWDPTEYTCTAVNGVNGESVGNASATFQTSPLAPEPPLLLGYPDGSFEYNTTYRRLSLQCVGFGSPVPRITWSSTSLSIADFRVADDDYNIYTEEFLDMATGDVMVLSILELCNGSVYELGGLEFTCSVDNGVRDDPVAMGTTNSTFVLNPQVQIVYYTYELLSTTGKLQITFSGPVDLRISEDGAIYGCDARALTLHGGRSENASFFQPRYPGTCEQRNEIDIILYLDEQDYIAIIEQGDLFIFLDNTFLSWESNFLVGPVSVVRTDEPIQVFEYTVLTDPVFVSSFDMDFNSKLLLVNFEPFVNLATFNVTSITLSRSPTSGASYGLNSSYIDPQANFATTVCVSLSQSDIMALYDLGICSSWGDCYANFDSNLVEDFVQNAVIPVTLQVSALRQVFAMHPLIYMELTVETPECEVEILLSQGGVYLVRGNERVKWISCIGGTSDINPMLTVSEERLSPEYYGATVASESHNKTSVYFSDGFPGSNIIFCESERGVYTQIYIQVDISVTIFPPLTVVKSDESTASITCTPSYPRLPIVWTGREQLQELSNETVLVVDNPVDGQAFTCQLVNGTAAVSTLVRVIPDDVTVLKDGMQLTDGSVLTNEGNLTLQCLTTIGNYYPIWSVIRATSMDTPPWYTVTRSSVNEATLTLYNIDGFSGTLRCQSPLSNLDVNIFLTEEDMPILCASETDPMWNITWSRTPSSSNDQKPCPDIRGRASEGSALRFCGENGVWNDTVDVSLCRSAEISQLDSMANALFTGDTAPSDDDLLDLTNNAITATEPIDQGTLFPRDLDTANDIVESVVGALRENIESDAATRLNTEIADVLNNIISENNQEGYRQLQDLMEVGSQKTLENAESYAAYLGEAVASSAIPTGDNETVARGNIVFEVMRIPAVATDVTFPSEATLRERARIRLPATLLTARLAKSVVGITLMNLENVLPNKRKDDLGDPASLILSSLIITDQTVAPEELDPAELEFTTNEVSNDAVNPKCAFWNYSEPIGNGVWSTEGVETDSSTKTGDGRFNVNCRIFHFTSFVVLVETATAQDEDLEEELSHTTSTYFGAGVLLLCAVMSIIVLLAGMAVSCGQQTGVGVHQLFHLMFLLALLCGYVAFLGGLTTALDNDVGCTAVAGLLQYFFTAAFSWLMFETATLPIMLWVGDYTSISKVLWLPFLVIGWILPAIPTAISLGLLHDDYGTDTHCWINFEPDDVTDNDALIAFVVPKLAFALVTILLLLLGMACNCRLLASGLKNSPKKEDFCRAWLLSGMVVLLLPLLGGSWVFALFWANDEWDISEWLFMGCSIAMGLVVFTLTMMLCITDKKVAAMNSKYPLQAAGQKEEPRRQLRRRGSSLSGEKYWSDTKPILPEASYELKEKAAGGETMTDGQPDAATTIENKYEANPMGSPAGGGVATSEGEKKEAV